MNTNIKPPEKNDYLIAELDGKTALVRVLRVNGDDIKGKHEFKDQEVDVEIDISDVKANLGPKPQIGRVYGCSTERLIDVTDTKPVSTVEWYFSADDEVKEVVHAGILAGAKLLRKLNIHYILRVLKIAVVLNTSRNLTAKAVIGTYATKGGSEENPDILTLKYHKDMLELLPRLMCHESAHGIWARLMPTSLRAKWVISFFNQSTLTKVDASVTRKAISQCVTDKSIVLVEPELQAALNVVLGKIKETSGLRTMDVATLLQENVNAAKAVLGPWRDFPTETGEWETHVTEYANTNVSEFFAEAMANHCTGITTPDYLKELLEETLETVAGQSVLENTD